MQGTLGDECEGVQIPKMQRRSPPLSLEQLSLHAESRNAITALNTELAKLHTIKLSKPTDDLGYPPPDSPGSDRCARRTLRLMPLKRQLGCAVRTEPISPIMGDGCLP